MTNGSSSQLFLLTVRWLSTPPARLVKACSCSTSSPQQHPAAASSAGPHWTLTTLAQHLHYYQLSPWPPLDTPAGGQRLLKVKAQLVVVDTLIRTIEGEENSADTTKNFSRYCAMPLKAADIALLRIDHAGKDLTRGQRGTSAKRDDLDLVWLLKPASGNLPGKTMLTLKREATRVDWIQQDVHITRHEGPPLHHTIPTFSELTSADMGIVNYLQKQGLTRHNITNQSAREALNHSTLAAKGTRLTHIVRWVKKYGNDPPDGGKRGGKREKNREGKREGKREAEKGNARQKRETRGKQGKGNISPPIGGGNGPTPNPIEAIKDGELPIPW